MELCGAPQLGLNGFADWAVEEFEAAYFGNSTERRSPSAVGSVTPPSHTPVRMTQGDMKHTRPLYVTGILLGKQSDK